MEEFIEYDPEILLKKQEELEFDLETLLKTQEVIKNYLETPLKTQEEIEFDLETIFKPQEVKEFDLETILKMKETHDFHCPSCNSCITKIQAYEKRNPKPISREINILSSNSFDKIDYFSLDDSQPPAISGELFQGIDFSSDESQPTISDDFRGIKSSSNDSQPGDFGIRRRRRPRLQTQIPTKLHRIQPQKQIQKCSGSEAYVPIGRSLEIIKSIVYGGLMEFIASLCIVFSAAGANIPSLNVLAMGLANTFGGLFLISHDLWDLKNESQRGISDEVTELLNHYQHILGERAFSHEVTEQLDRYQHLLGKRAYFSLHVSIALLSSIIFGLLPPIIYGFSIGESIDRDIKLPMTILASIICLVTLAVAKVYVQRASKSYFKSIAYYVILGFMVSAVSFVFGNLIMTFLEKIDLFYPGSVSSKQFVCA